jgi:hypothetical protein
MIMLSLIMFSTFQTDCEVYWISDPHQPPPPPPGGNDKKKKKINKIIANAQMPTQFGIHQTIQKNSVGFIPWDGITVGKHRIP